MVVDLAFERVHVILELLFLPVYDCLAVGEGLGGGGVGVETDVVVLGGETGDGDFGGQFV